MELQSALISIIIPIGIAVIVIAIFMAIAAAIWEGITGKPFPLNRRRRR